MKRRNRLGWVSGVAAISLLVTACGGSGGEPSPGADSASVEEETAPATGGRLVIAEGNVPDTFDPIRSSLIQTSFVWQWVYESLVEVKPDGTAEPLLATDWEVSDDGLTYTFNLREGVTFHNGQAFDAEDVVFSFERMLADGIPYATGRFPTLESIEAVDPLTAVFTLSEPDSGFLSNHGNPFMFGAAIVSRTAAEELDLSAQMVGTGPYQWVDYSPDRELNLTRFDDYWRDDLPIADDIVIRYMPEQSAQVAAMRAGDVDVMFPSSETYRTLENAPGIQVEAVSSANVIRLGTAGSPPFDDVRVRQALALAIDRQEIVDGAMLGAGTPSGYVPPAYDWATPLDDLPHHTQDVERARELLTEAGYPDGFDIEISHLGSYATYMDRFIEILQSQLAEVGITSTIIPREITTWQDYLETANYDITPNEFSFQPDPYWYIVPREGRQSPNPPELQALLDDVKAAAAEDLPEAIRAVEQWQAEHVFPDLGIAARDQWVAAREGVGLSTPEFSLSRRFLFSTTPPAS
jgi:peptide/nickel transport system substrate-binding protein